MWPGPYGEWGSRKYLLASLDQSLQRMGLDYVDIFYSHRFDPDTPLEETLGALDTAVKQGKALYAGISSYSGARTQEAVQILQGLGTPLLIHQPSYSLVNRWIEDDLLGVLEDEGVGCIVFSPLGQGLLTNRYLNGVPEDSRAAKGTFFEGAGSRSRTSSHVRALNEIAEGRGQSLAQMADRVGAARRARHLRADRARAACASSTTTSTRSTTSTSPTTSSPPIDEHAVDLGHQHLGGVELVLSVLCG